MVLPRCESVRCDSSSIKTAAGRSLTENTTIMLCPGDVRSRSSVAVCRISNARSRQGKVLVGFLRDSRVATGNGHQRGAGPWLYSTCPGTCLIAAYSCVMTVAHTCSRFAADES